MLLKILITSRCPNTYADLAGLRHHQKVIHEGQRKFCHECGESFKGPSSFAVHKRVVVRSLFFSSDRYEH